MSRNGNPESEKIDSETKTTPDLPQHKKRKKKCGISRKIGYVNVDEIRENLCQLTEITKHTDGRNYCLFHLPTENKNIEEFEQKFRERLKAAEEAVAELKKLPEDKQREAEKTLYYDFRYVWFPATVKLENYIFEHTSDFSGAIFRYDAFFSETVFKSMALFKSTIFVSDVYFDSVTFTYGVSFLSAVFGAETHFISTKFIYLTAFNEAMFISDADFSEAEFTDEVRFESVRFAALADFSAAKFSSDVKFGLAQFMNEAYFEEVMFTSDVNFNSVIFMSDVDFSLAIFGAKSQFYFLETKFCSTVSFNKTEIEGYIEFEDNVFLNENAVKEVSIELKEELFLLRKALKKYDIEMEDPPFFFNKHQEAILNFQNVRLRNPERVSFNSDTLRPNWFVNVDETRKIAFNDIEWLNTEIDVNRDGLEEELKSLKNRKVSRRVRSLIKACNQLAENAEVNRRVEEAKQFRKNSIALDKKVVCHVHDSIDLEFKPDIWDKVCVEYPVVNEDAGNYYCLWHNPAKNKAGVFQEELRKRIKKKHSHFQGVIFPITVEYKIAEKIEEDKYETKIIDLPKNLDFSHATFQKRLVIEDNTIHNLKLENIFVEKHAEFVIKNSKCDGKIDFENAVIEGKLFIEGKEEEKNGQERVTDKEFFIDTEEALSLYNIRIDKPEWINFRCIRLRPHYFQGVDASKFVFHDCEWTKQDEKKINIEEEINLSSYKALAQACNKLAINYEENRHYEESSAFRYTAMEAKRLNPEYRFGKICNLYWFYKWTSGYGESRWWAFFVLIGLLFGFGFFYEWFGVFQMDNPQYLIGGEGYIYSLYVAALQRPEPKALNGWTKSIVILETILAPLQAALLALAIRRKFMR